MPAVSGNIPWSTTCRIRFTCMILRKLYGCCKAESKCSGATLWDPTAGLAGFNPTLNHKQHLQPRSQWCKSQLKKHPEAGFNKTLQSKRQFYSILTIAWGGAGRGGRKVGNGWFLPQTFSGNTTSPGDHSTQRKPGYSCKLVAFPCSSLHQHLLGSLIPFPQVPTHFCSEIKRSLQI